MTGWLLSPAPLARVAVLRVVALLFVPVDVLLTTTFVRGHASVPAELYVAAASRPAAAAADAGPVGRGPAGRARRRRAARSARRGPRRAPPAGRLPVAALYLEWMVVAMSYGKVDHDRFAFLVLLFVLPSVGRAPLRSTARTQAAGWALWMVALAVVATYVLAACAKLRFGGWDWADGATLTRAVLRRGTALSEPLLDVPVLLHAAQYGILAMELLVAPLLLVPWRDERRTWLLALGFLGFHLVTFAMITIVFLPHCVALLALLPLERLVRAREPVPA